MPSLRVNKNRLAIKKLLANLEEDPTDELRPTTKSPKKRNRDQATRLVGTKETARRMQKRGIAVLAIKPPQKGSPASGKAPATRHGVKDATEDHWAFLKQIEGFRSVNLAVATGRASNLLCLDVGPRHGGEGTMKKLIKQLGSLPSTWQSQTGGGGKHIFFQYPADDVRSDTRGKLLGPGVDVLSDGSYAVIPPSKHRSGQIYVWLPGGRPEC